MRYKPGYKPSPQGMLLPQPPPKQPKHTSERNPFLGIAATCTLLVYFCTSCTVYTSIYNNPVCSARGRLPLQPCASQCLPCHAAQLQLHPQVIFSRLHPHPTTSTCIIIIVAITLYSYCEYSYSEYSYSPQSPFLLFSLYSVHSLPIDTGHKMDL